LKERLALYKQPNPGEAFAHSPDSEDSGATVRPLRKVDTDDLGFSWPHGSGGSPPKKKANVQQVPMQTEATAQEQATAQVQLTTHVTASCLIEALSADPVHPALKQTLKEKRAGAVPKSSAKTRQQKEEAVAEEEQEEFEGEEGVVEEAKEAHEEEKEAEEWGVEVAKMAAQGC
jgi:C4-dicarboxylate-specific signal transduction histidine kinase